MNDAFGKEVINSYIKLRNSEINEFKQKESFDKTKAITKWERVNTLDCQNMTILSNGHMWKHSEFIENKNYSFNKNLLFWGSFIAWHVNSSLGRKVNKVDRCL